MITNKAHKLSWEDGGEIAEGASCIVRIWLAGTWSAVEMPAHTKKQHTFSSE
jgi:hypothetical protein